MCSIVPNAKQTEATMGYEKGREALKTENELLAKLYDVAAEHAKSLPKDAGVVVVMSFVISSSV